MAVYFIQAGDGGPIKIGTATNPLERISQLQTAHHEQLNIIGIIQGDYQVERSIHERLSNFRIRGEWFTPSWEVLDIAHGKIGEFVTITDNEIEDEARVRAAYAVSDYWRYRVGTDPYFIEETIESAMQSMTAFVVFNLIDSIDTRKRPDQQIEQFIELARDYLHKEGIFDSDFLSLSVDGIYGWSDYVKKQIAIDSGDR